MRYQSGLISRVTERSGSFVRYRMKASKTLPIVAELTISAGRSPARTNFARVSALVPRARLNMHLRPFLAHIDPSNDHSIDPLFLTS